MASQHCVSACVNVRVCVWMKVASAFHFSTFICPCCGLRGPVHQSHRCMVTSSRAAFFSPKLGSLAKAALWTQPYQTSASPLFGKNEHALLYNVFLMGAGICEGVGTLRWNRFLTGPLCCAEEKSLFAVTSAWCAVEDVLSCDYSLKGKTTTFQ